MVLDLYHTTLAGRVVVAHRMVLLMIVGRDAVGVVSGQKAEIFSILLTILMTRKDGNMPEILKKHLGRSGPPAPSDESPSYDYG